MLVRRRTGRRRSANSYSMTDRINAQMIHLHRIIDAGDVQCVINLRMNHNAFARLCYLLTNVGGVVDSRYVRVEEKGVLKLHPLLLVKFSPIDENCSNETWKWFKGCLGALDGTHIAVHVPCQQRAKYRTRKGTIAVNVLGVCDINMNFIYVLTGWEGSAADARVLRDALTGDDSFKVPRGCYYLCDNGYANTEGFLTPFRRVRYHRDAWGNRAAGPQNYKELYNWRHSQALNVIERAFGLLKKRWAILRSPSFYPVKVQNRIILACTLLHNFIRSQMTEDPMEEFEEVVGSPINHLLEMYSNATSGSVNGSAKKPEKTRRSWSEREEEVLIHALKDVISKGWKSDNGFRSGYLSLLETTLQTEIRGCNLRAIPHINSKIHVWKKTYSTLVTILTRSGVGWNDAEHTIDATDETWEDIIKGDQSLRTMRHKQWIHFHDWCEIFGNDRAAGDERMNCDNALFDVFKLSDEPLTNESTPIDTPTAPVLEVSGDSISDTPTPSSKPTSTTTSKRNKRMKVNDVDESIVKAINNFAHITDKTMSALIKEMAAEEKISAAQDMVLEGVQGLTELNEEEQVRAAQLLFKSHDELALFKRLGEKGRICLVKRLLKGDE
ncbi:uncharacterized protein [Henckelia pumila]|uniref:uncharacterized protein n=1 Tax=Henckelia pumila TaxID=405737 RepID=UPI003C6E9A41